jgi:flagellar hook assembly protein FlgD
VHLRVYDVAGREVAQLVDGRLHPAGFHAVVWNGSDRTGRRAAPGVYFCRLETNLGTQSRKLLLLR